MATKQITRNIALTPHFDQFVQSKIESAIKTVTKSPGADHKRPDLTSRDILFYNIHSYLVIHRPVQKPLHVLRVLHAARDIKSILEG
jgi:antitoxin ParD1/3/4/toxin ParE1/3/4